MPLYDCECAHGHRFERLCSIAERETPVPCEGTVNDLVLDDELVAKCSVPGAVLEGGLEWVELAPGQRPVLVRKVPCRLQARLVIGPHNNPGGMLAHGAASNRDAALEGRYDPLNPSRRFMSKGRGWRK